jgi:STE24 endopeptidase
MQVVVLMAFVVAMTFADLARQPEVTRLLPPLVASRWLIMPAMVAYLAGAVAAGAFRTALSLRAIARSPDGPLGSARRHNVMTLLGQAWLVAGLAGVILLGYGPWVLEDLLLEHVPLVAEAVVLGPFIVALLLHWLLEYPLYRAVRGRIAERQVLAGLTARPPWTLGEYLGYNLRHHLLFVAVPVGLILLLTDSLVLASRHLPRLTLGVVHAASAVLRLVGIDSPGLAGDIVKTGGLLVCAGGVLICAPLLIARVWRTARLPAGRLRDDLWRTCRQMKLNCRDLLVWRSGGMIANAGVMGLIGRLRYVLLSDALLEQMDDRQIKAIFAHEAGHIKAHHLFYALLFAVSSVTLCSAAGELTAAAMGLEWWIGQVLTLALLVAAWLGVFGWISRRFERQSDVMAAWSCGPEGGAPDGRITPEGAAIFSRSLERVAQLNGTSPGQWNWRHGSIAGRVEHVMWLGSTAGTREGIDRVVRRIKAALWLATAVGAAITVARLAWGV